ncbi:MAG TPA: gas vesicle protein [Deltaproteobacteria bacterium]|nr:MAG: gas vesicle protein GVPa [Deltaproteobacteria bacterium GWA2_55_82]OGQ63513.1 MAG: gas vesicle protein GVPa [Deltaproteobacteria bacterium RIFCSPLOWO2_02_FULL_55_12]OIJ74894.1 MAG: gas vesicle protein GVPa [Deltaproteobacteria bacterium GWC2_55_46]HBG47454.1 gas vesicle protein [Deltaproteobacteria bacterium]HCY11470.1 gas vesicle protein [Deltaproteobacteria bacterium]
MTVKAAHTEYTILDVVDRILDKGLAINADISISIAGTELLGIKIRAALASFETAAKYGLEFPSGVERGSPAWQDAGVLKESCPGCGKKQPARELLEQRCPWCGWMSASAKERETSLIMELK